VTFSLQKKRRKMDEKETKKTRRRDEKEKKKTGKNHRRHFSLANI
jgi:hypothetical protein